ncbi:MAG: hypothetical protein PHR68_05685 [Candidatus Gracilibacteria bacterium]|nr:hypothetical protein [Candidatus Gracilibacteria bacterium]
MTTELKEKSIKSSFTIKENLFNRLASNPNKSKIVNEALAIYFEKNDYINKAEEEFWNEKIRLGLFDVENGDTTVINPNGEKLTKELLNKTLWA